MVHKIDLVEDIKVKVSIGRTYQKVEALNKSFQEAYQILPSIDICDVGHVDEVDGYHEGNVSPYPFRQMEAIVELINLGSTDDANNQLNNLIEEVSLSGNAMDLIKDYYVQIYYDIRRVLYERDGHSYRASKPIANDLRQAVMLEEVVDIIRMETSQLIHYIDTTVGKGDQVLTGIIYDYVHSHYKKNVSLEDLAKEIDKTSQYTSKIFKELFGVNFVEYLSNIRIEEAKSLLKDTTLRVKEIALEVGYDDANYFCRIFKKKLGMTPKEFRRS